MGNSFQALLARSLLVNFTSVPGDKTERCPTTMRCLVASLCRALTCMPAASINTRSAREKANPKESHALSRPPNPTDRSCSSAPCGLPLPTSGSVPCARLSLRSKFRAQPQGLCAAVGKLRFSGNLQCPKALLQYCGNRSLLQCCGNALRHCGLLQCAQCIAAMAPLQ